MQNEFKNKTQQYIASRKHISAPKTNIDSKLKGWKIFQANGVQRKVRVAVLISDKIDFKVKKVKKDTNGHFIMIKGVMHQEDITLIKLSLIHI